MHRTSGGRLALSLALLLVGRARAEPGDARLHQVDPTTTAISGIRIGMKERDVLARLGKPRAIESGRSEMDDEPWRTVRYDGLRLQFAGGGISGLWCTGKRCATDRGVKVGDSRARVTEIYGPGNPPYEGSERDTLSYPLRGIDVYLVFLFEKDRVVAIEFFCDYA